MATLARPHPRPGRAPAYCRVVADRSVRPAVAGDGPAVAAVQAAALAADHPSLDPRLVEALTGEVPVAAWDRAATAPPPGHRLLVALEDREVVGYAAVGASADPDADAALELLELRVTPARGRRGHGSRLLAAVADTAGRLGAAELLCWADDGGPLGTLLESAGWGDDGARRELQAAGTTVAQRRLRTGLAGPPPTAP